MRATVSALVLINALVLCSIHLGHSAPKKKCQDLIKSGSKCKIKPIEKEGSDCNKVCSCPKGHKDKNSSLNLPCQTEEGALACCCVKYGQEKKREKRTVDGKGTEEEDEEEEEEEEEEESDSEEEDESDDEEDESQESAEEDDDAKDDDGEEEEAGEDLTDDPAEATTAPSAAKSAEECRANIMKKYPNAECGKSKGKEECKKQCEKKGEAKCQGSQGEIHKLNCKGEEPSKDGFVTCCCAVTCESAEKTQSRLNEEMKAEMGEDSSGICVNVTKESGSDPGEKLKVKLKELCSTQDPVFVARKYCLEEKKGKYFCVKDGKCLSKHCIGCLKHECEVGGDKSIVNPPEDYMKKHLELKDFDKNVAVNVDDMKDVEKVGKWCTMVDDRTKCKGTCQKFGDRMCDGEALKYDHDDFCKRNAKQCKCCCEPVCKGKTEKGGGGEEKKDEVKKKQVVEEENVTEEEESETEDTEEDDETEETVSDEKDTVKKKNKTRKQGKKGKKKKSKE